MICDICESPAEKELLIRDQDGVRVIGHFCFKCEVVFTNCIIETVNRRMEDRYGRRCFLMPKLDESGVGDNND